MRRRASKLLKGILLPLLCAIYPVIFLYSNNVNILAISAVKAPLLIVVAIAVLLFAGFLLVQKSPLRASISTFAFLIFFHTYGLLFARLAKLDSIQIEHYTVFPVVVICALYAAFFLSKLRLKAARTLQNILLILVSGLVLVNLVIALPVEIKRAQAQVAKEPPAQPLAAHEASYPDIYFIILDEYSGFDALDGYWKTSGYKEFETFLKEKGFFLARHSHGATIDTIVEIASRLNMKQYPVPDNPAELFEAISNNRVMQVLKSYGYTTVVLDGAKLAYPTKPEIIADYHFKPDTTASSGVLSTNEFSILFYNQTMLRIFSNVYQLNDASTEAFREMILFSLEKAADLGDIPTPKFVYLHLMLPHWPFMFDENGGPVDVKHKFDWNYYLGQHMYASKRAQELVTQILSQSDPARPPVIILQSDHGARNILNTGGDGVILENYPDSYKTNILNALYLPGFDTAQLAEDMPAVDTFAIILNHYFQAGITVEK